MIFDQEVIKSMESYIAEMKRFTNENFLHIQVCITSANT